MDRIMVDIVKFLNISHSDINRFHHDYSYTTAQQKHKSTQKIVCSIIYILNIKNNFSYSCVLVNSDLTQVNSILSQVNSDLS